MEKKTLPQELEAMLTAQAVRERPIRLMFQDEARFGRMVRIRRCWAPAPLRPVVFNGYEREFTYVYGSVSPWHGELDWSLSDKMNTAQMAAVVERLRNGMTALAADAERVRSITAWPWIVSLNLKAN